MLLTIMILNTVQPYFCLATSLAKSFYCTSSTTVICRARFAAAFSSSTGYVAVHCSHSSAAGMAETRRHILLNIKDQAKYVNSNEPQPQMHVWTSQQWWESFQFLFINCVPTADSAHHHDDLLFFAKSASHPTAKNPPFFVRRKGKQLPEELQLSGKDFGNVDWPQTVLLNIVLQSQYQLTVVACGREALPFVAEGRTWASDMITVSKPVYASTTVTAVNLDSSRAEASNPQPCYPDICFAVDNFDNAFEDLVLEDADKCYCVVLHAILDQHDHAAAEPYPGLEAVSSRISSNKHVSSSSSSAAAPAGASTDRPQQQQQQGLQHPAGTGSSSVGSSNHAAAQAGSSGSAGAATAAAAAAGAAGNTSPEGSGDGADGSHLAWQIGTHTHTLFAGYVSFGQIVDFMETNGRSKNLLDALMGSKAVQQDKVVMTGPGGMGRCEVAVTKLEQPSRSTGATPVSSSHGGHAAEAAAAKVAAGDSSDASGSSRADRQAAAVLQQQQLQRGLLQRGFQRARMLATGVQQALSDINSGMSCNMMCAMMLLKLPVHYLAQELLDAV